MDRRWDLDARGRGIGDGPRLVPGARELLDALARPDWVAEDPDAHLLPHLRRWCASHGHVLLLRVQGAFG